VTHLTPREREVVELIGRDGVGYKTVAKTLGISVHTVREHVRRVASRVESCRSPREAVVVIYHRERVAATGSTTDGDF